MVSIGLILIAAAPLALARRTRAPSEFQRQDALAALRNAFDGKPQGETFKRPYEKECPRYDPIHASEWQLDLEDWLTSDVLLPNVDQSTLSTKIDNSGDLIYVRGLRKITAPLSCLPRSAKVTSDGQFEILEASIHVPQRGDGQKTQVETFTGGVQLFVPLKMTCPQYKPARASQWNLDSEDQLTVIVDLPGADQSTMRTVLADGGAAIRVSGLRKLSAHALSCLPPDAQVTKDQRHEIVEILVHVPKDGDGAKAQVETSRGQVQVFVPLKVHCPQYKPIRTLDWEFDSEQRLTLNVELPDVDQSTVQTVLDDEETTIHITGLRKLHLGARACLPKGAKVTKDGKYEIVEVAVPVPKNGDAQEVTVQEVDGGVQVAMPSKQRPCPPYKKVRASEWELDAQQQWMLEVELPGVDQDTVRVWADKDDLRIHIKAMRDVRNHRPECLPEDANVIANNGYEILKTIVAVPPGSSAQEAQIDSSPDSIRLYLPSQIRTGASKETPFDPTSQRKEGPSNDLDHEQIMDAGGIVIEHVEYDWPDKDTDASEGFVDNQGVFRNY